MHKLTTADAVIRFLGGYGPVAELTKANRDTVYEWRRLGHFPSRTLLVMQAALEENKATAPTALWKMIEP